MEGYFGMDSGLILQQKNEDNDNRYILSFMFMSWKDIIYVKIINFEIVRIPDRLINI